MRERWNFLSKEKYLCKCLKLFLILKIKNLIEGGRIHSPTVKNIKHMVIDIFQVYKCWNKPYMYN